MHRQVQSSNLCHHAAGRIVDCKAKVVLTSSGVMRGAKHIDLKAIVDGALGQCTKEVRGSTGVLACVPCYRWPRVQQSRQLCVSLLCAGASIASWFTAIETYVAAPVAYVHMLTAVPMTPH